MAGEKTFGSGEVVGVDFKIVQFEGDSHVLAKVIRFEFWTNKAFVHAFRELLLFRQALRCCCGHQKDLFAYFLLYFIQRRMFILL